MPREADGERLTWRANPDWWTHAGAHIPWLRKDSHLLHMVRSTSEGQVESLLRQAGYECLRLDGRGLWTGEQLVEASKPVLKLWDYCGRRWDSWRDCLRDVDDIWEGTDRLALLWQDADVLLRADLQSWLIALSILEETSRDLQTKPKLLAGQTLSDDFVPARLMVFEVFCFVDGYGAQGPPDAS